MESNVNLVRSVCINFHVVYNGDIPKVYDFKFFVREEEATEMIAHAISYIPGEDMNTLKMDRSKPLFLEEMNLTTKEDIEDFMIKTFDLKIPKLKLEQGNKNGE